MRIYNTHLSSSTKTVGLIVSISLTLLTFPGVLQNPTLPGTSPFSDIDIRSLEKKVHERVNKERNKRKIAPLSYEPGLVKIARDHSQDMSNQGYFDHINIAGQTPTERAKVAGFECNYKSHEGVFPTGIAENILMTYLYESYEVRVKNGQESKNYNWKNIDTLAREIVKNWMDSKGHRANILRKDFHHEGIGIVKNDALQIFVTQNFC